MNVLEKILEEIKQYTKDVYECDLDDIVEYQRRNREDKCVYILQGIEEAAVFIRSHMDEAKGTNVPSNDDWIPVEERLPESKTHVLCCFENGTVDALWQDWKDRGFGGYFDDDFTPMEVVAWRPLPEPYKPKKQD